MPSRRNWISFWSLFAVQTQNAFNDKAAQFLLIPMAGAIVYAAKQSGQDVGFLGENMAHVLGALIVLPFILLAPLSGWLSDRFSKTVVIRGALYLQLAVLALIVFALSMQNLQLAVLGFFLLSVESVVLSPAKKGIVKELVGHNRLGFASGVLEMSVILAVCFGQIVSGWWYDIRRAAGHDIWDAAYFPMVLVAAAALVSLWVSYGVEKVKPIGKRPFSAKIVFEHIGQLQDLWYDRRIRLSGVGIAFFWGFAGFINLAAIQIGSDLSGGGGTGFGSENSWLMLAASGGIAFGGVIASLLCKRKIELGLVPIGGLIMVVGSLALALGPIERYWLMTWMALSGAGGALLLVPLNAYLQDVCEPSKRGRVLAGLNLLDCLAGFLAVVVQFLMSHFNLSYGVQFGCLALGSAWVTWYSARLLPQQLLRFLFLALFRFFYRVKVMHADRIPASGGVLLTPNHVSYIDAFVLSAACPRPIRFVLFDEYFDHPTVGRFVRLFQSIPIARTRAKEGMRLASQALKDGEVVCIFPEGQLTRSGGMNTFMRGFEMIARRAGTPVIPVAMDGLWGSIFSFERNRFIYKKPYRLSYSVRVNIGASLDPKEATATVVRHEIEQLRAEAMGARAAMLEPAGILATGVNLVSTEGSLCEEAHRALTSGPDDKQREVVANAFQLMELNGIQRGATVMIDWDGVTPCRDVLGVALPRVAGLKVVGVSSDWDDARLSALAEEYDVAHCLGGERLARWWKNSSTKAECYDFSEGALERFCAHGERAAFPCLVANGRVVSMSIPHPQKQTRINDEQDGHREGTWGRLLPGYVLERRNGTLFVSGVSLRSGELEIPQMERADDGMLVPFFEADETKQV